MESNRTGCKQRQIAMDRYFRYTEDDDMCKCNKVYQKPCEIDFEGEKYTSFTNGYSIVLTKEVNYDMEQFENPEVYPAFEIGKQMVVEGTGKKVDFSSVLDEARSKGYRLKRSEVEDSKEWKYVFCYDGRYYKIGLLDISYRIISNGGKSIVFQKGNSKSSPLIIKNDIGYCLLLPMAVKPELLRKNKVVIDVA